MRRTTTPVILTLATLATLATLGTLGGCGSSTSGIEVDGNAVRVSTDQMDVTFARKEAIDDTYMIFGGMSANRSDMTSKATIVGLSMQDARPIHAEYPDFHMCKSGGAGLAQAATRQMDIIPADGAVLACLQEALTKHAANLQAGGDRICVRLRGSVLKMTSAKVGDREILEELPGPVRRDHYLVESASLVAAHDALQRP